MIKPIDNATLAAIGGEQAVRTSSAFAQTMNQTAQVMGQMRVQKDELALAEDKWKAQQAINKREGEAAELDMHIKRAELQGRAAIGVLELLNDGTNPKVAATKYADWREQQPEGVRKYMPEAGSDIGSLKEWAKMSAMQSSQGVPYLKALKTDSTLREWQFLLKSYQDRNNGIASPEQLDFIKFKESMSPQAVRAPNDSQLSSAFIALDGYKIKGDSLTDMLSKDDQLLVANDVAQKINALSEIARTRNNPEAMQNAPTMAMDLLIQEGKLVPTETIIGSATISDAAKKYLPKELLDAMPELVKGTKYTYVANPQAYDESLKLIQEAEDRATQEAMKSSAVATGTGSTKAVTEADAPVGLKAGEVREKDGYLWRINPDTGRPQWAKKP